jgi:Cu-processing system ATP-binding protein
MSEVPIVLREVSKAYGKRAAVSAVDLELRQGERVALVGHNGAGKSTLIKLMLRLVRPTSGSVQVLGANPADPDAIGTRRRLGYLPENVALQPTLTGAELLAFYARLKQQPVAKNAELLERVGIAYAAQSRIATYSKGMRQRLALAQALIGPPSVLLLDEPTTGLDPALRQTFYAIIRDLSTEGATVLLSSHALTELEGQTDRVIVMNRGRKVADGTLAELRRLAQQPVRIRFTLRGDQVNLFPRIAGSALEWRRVSERTFEVSCAEQEKVEVVRQFTGGSLPLDDVEILAPSLDDIYAHFLFAEAAE